jgi:hypothetical protein
LKDTRRVAVDIVDKQCGRVIRTIDGKRLLVFGTITVVIIDSNGLKSKDVAPVFSSFGRLNVGGKCGNHSGVPQDDGREPRGVDSHLCVQGIPRDDVGYSTTMKQL